MLRGQVGGSVPASLTAKVSFAGLDKGLALQTASRLEPPFTQTTDHPDLVPLSNGSTNPSNTEINQALPSRMHVRTAGGSATTASGTSSAPQRNFDDIIKFLEKELEPRPRLV